MPNDPLQNVAVLLAAEINAHGPKEIMERLVDVDIAAFYKLDGYLNGVKDEND